MTDKTEMKINEIFYSIQGEGKNTGLPTIFVRTMKCNLRCSYCDTKYAYENGKETNISDIIKEISKYPCKNICITGGEPLLQEETPSLIDILLEKKYKISLETNGSINIKNLLNKKSLMISLDIKCPSSDMHKKMDINNIKLLRKTDQLKFIIKDKKDYTYAKKIIQKYEPICSIFIQPVYGTNPKDLSNWILKDGLNIRLGLQIHKIIWGKKRGF